MALGIAAAVMPVPTSLTTYYSLLITYCAGELPWQHLLPTKYYLLLYYLVLTMQASFVAAPAAICGEADCSGSGTASAPLSIEVRRSNPKPDPNPNPNPSPNPNPNPNPYEVRPSGWGGDAGFLYGALYSLEP